MAWLRHELRLFLIALQFLTRLPVPHWVGFAPTLLQRAVRYFPLVGALVGVVGALVALGALQLWPATVAATLAVASTLWLTVAFHEDGLADTFDALLGAAAREKALTIMKDSRIGSYGAAVLATSLLLRVLLLAELLARGGLPAAAAFVAAHASGRAIAVTLMLALPYAGDTTQTKAPSLTKSTLQADVVLAVLFGVVPLALAAAVQPDAVWTFIMVVGALALLVLVLRNWLRHRIGGYTGDTLGAAEQLGELTVLLIFVAQWSQ